MLGWRRHRKDFLKGLLNLKGLPARCKSVAVSSHLKGCNKGSLSGLSPVPAFSSPFIKSTRRGRVQSRAPSSLPLSPPCSFTPSVFVFPGPGLVFFTPPEPLSRSFLNAFSSVDNESGGGGNERKRGSP